MEENSIRKKLQKYNKVKKRDKREIYAIKRNGELRIYDVSKKINTEYVCHDNKIYTLENIKELYKKIKSDKKIMEYILESTKEENISEDKAIRLFIASLNWEKVILNMIV